MTVLYVIVNTFNGRKYYGTTTSFKTRIYTHFNSLRNNRHNNTGLQSDYSFFGESNFKVILINNYGDDLKAIRLERKLILQDKVCYNIFKCLVRPTYKYPKRKPILTELALKRK